MSENKIFAISDLVNRLEKIANANRYDQVSRLMHEVYEKRMEKNPTLTVTASEIVDMVAEIGNFNSDSNFKLEMSEVFDTDTPVTISEGSPFRMAGYEEDFRPTPIEVHKSEEEIIKDASFNLLKKVATGHITNPQYHFGQFVNIKKAGPNSGVALWTVAFNTKRGIATVSVPVNVIAGKVQNPEVFYPTGEGKGRSYTSQGLREFANEFNPADKGPSTELSGFNNLGANTIITDRQDIKEANPEEQAMENSNISLSYSIPVDEDLTANVGEVEEAFNKALDEARTYVETKIKGEAGIGKNLNINIDISYSGALGLDGEAIDTSIKNPSGVFAFNASQKTRKGLKTITIPVVLSNNRMDAPAFYTENGSIPLTSTTVSEYFSSNNVEEKLETSSTPTDAFTEAFTAYFKNDATYGEIVNEIRACVRDGEFVKAASYLSIINDRFGENALKKASDDYISFVRISADERRSEQADSFFINSNISFQG